MRRCVTRREEGGGVEYLEALLVASGQPRWNRSVFCHGDHHEYIGVFGGAAGGKRGASLESKRRPSPRSGFVLF